MNYFKTLMEAAPNLPDNLKGMLISIYTSATPQQAYDTAMGAANTVSAKNELVRTGYASEQNGGVQLTQAGQNALLSSNLIDNTGKITDEGQSQLTAFENNKQEQINLESLQLFKGFVNELK